MIVDGFHVLVVMKGKALWVSLGGSGQANLDDTDVSVNGDKMAHLKNSCCRYSILLVSKNTFMVDRRIAKNSSLN